MKNKSRYIVSIFFMMLLVFTFSFGTSAAAAKLSKKSMTMNVGTKKTLTVTGTTSAVIWSSSKKSVATVSPEGVVTAKKKGTAKIRAKVGKKTYTCKVTVKQPVKSITLNKSSYFMMPGKTVKLTTTVLPSNANNKKVIWSSSNTAYAKVSSSGVVTALKNGTVKITAKAKDGSGVAASCTIIVLKNTVVSKPAAPTSTPKPTQAPTVTAPATGSGPTVFLKALEKISQQVQSDSSKGIVWKYNSTYTNQPKTLQDAINNNRRVTTCSWYVTWALKEAGVLEYKDNFSSKSGGVLYWNDNTKAHLTAKSTVYDYNGNCTLKDLYNAGMLKPGDICVYTNHMNVFVRYDSKNGIGYFYDAGRVHSNGAGTSDNYVFNTLGPVMWGMSNSVYHVVRLK